MSIYCIEHLDAPDRMRTLGCRSSCLPRHSCLPQCTHSHAAHRTACRSCRVEEAWADRTTLAMFWHEVRHTRLPTSPMSGALALYACRRGLVPEALSQDSLEGPVPTPQLQQFQLDGLEGATARHGYGSVICICRFDSGGGVGLMLVADLRPQSIRRGRAGDVIRLVAQRLSPALGRLSRRGRRSPASRCPPRTHRRVARQAIPTATARSPRRSGKRWSSARAATPACPRVAAGRPRRIEVLSSRQAPEGRSGSVHR